MDDQRLVKLDGKIDKVAADVASIRDMLISEPEASPLGRALIRRHQENRENISKLDDKFERFREEDFQPIWEWWQQSKGAWRLVLGTGVILGIIGAFFGILAFYGIRGG